MFLPASYRSEARPICPHSPRNLPRPGLAPGSFLHVLAAHLEQYVKLVVAHLDRTVFVQPLAHGGRKQLANFRFGMGASGSVVGKVKAGCIAHAMISQRPIEVVA